MKCPACKKNIPDNLLKCPHCKTRTGVICSNCSSVNSIGAINCTNCGNELLKVCSNCGSVNFPDAQKCRKCASPFVNNKSEDGITYSPKLMTFKQGFETLAEGLISAEKKVFSITGRRGIGKSLLLKSIIENDLSKGFKWGIAKCTSLTQLTPGGAIQDMLLNLFKLPNYASNSEDISQDLIKVFTKELKFLEENEVSDFVNFLYSSKDGHYEDIILNKKRTFDILNKIFSNFCASAKFVVVLDNFDYIDGFSIEFITNYIKNPKNQKYLKLIAVYEANKPIQSIFCVDFGAKNAYENIHLNDSSSVENLKISQEAGLYVSEREKQVILDKTKGNFAFVEQAISYCFDCQISDKAFLMPKTFPELINERLTTIKKINPEAHKMLCAAAILGDKLNPPLLKEIFGYKNEDFKDIISYLVKSNYIRKCNELTYEFSSMLLWEEILKNIEKDPIFEDINIKIGKTLSAYTININPIMAMIAHNLKENRLAFDIWTKITRLASYIGDINLYVIAQKQCLALLNEFNENETLDIRYNISERLGKLLTQYDPHEAIEYLPDAISRAKSNNDDVKEIELLGYLALCCKKTENYYGDVECADSILSMLKANQQLEKAMIKASKISSLLNIGNCGEVINLIDNDIMPVLTSTLQNPRLDTKIPLGIVYQTRINAYLYLAKALALQGNDRAFDELSTLFEIIGKHKIEDKILYGRAKLVCAFANTIKGHFQKSYDLLGNVANFWSLEDLDFNDLDSEMCENINNYNLINAINKIMLKDYAGLREDLYNWTMFAQNSGNEFYMNIYKTFLGKILCDSKQARRALEIYNEQVTYFADKKLAMGALLCWYFIAEATVIASSSQDAIDTAQRALDIAQNPKINNLYFSVQLRILLAKVFLKEADYESAKMNIELALNLAKKFEMHDLMSKIYLLYAKYYQDLGTVPSDKQIEYLKGADTMYNRALENVDQHTQSAYMKNTILECKQVFNQYCQEHGIVL